MLFRTQTVVNGRAWEPVLLGYMNTVSFTMTMIILFLLVSMIKTPSKSMTQNSNNDHKEKCSSKPAISIEFNDVDSI